jgi:ATP-dependent Zn protease
MMPQGGADSPGELAVLLRYMLGGRAAEEAVFGVAGGGSGGPERSDLAVATLLATCAEASWGMGDRLTWRGDPDADTLPGMLAMNRELAERVEARLRDALDGARKLLLMHRPALDALAAALMRKETLTGNEAEEVVRRATSGKTKPNPVSGPVAGPPA